MEIIEFSNEYRDETIQLLIDVAVNEYGFVNWEKWFRIFENEFYINDNGNCWLAIESGKVVGTISLKNLCNNIGEIKNLYVHSRYRNRKIAQSLLDTLIKFARSNGYNELQLDTYDEFKEAIKFYEKNSFYKYDFIDETYKYIYKRNLFEEDVNLQMKLNICLITPNVFPVPAVKGGACETLVETLIKENEKYNKLNLICVSIYNEEAFFQSKKYKNTNFIYIKETNKNEKIIDLSFNENDESMIDYMDSIYKQIKDLNIDFIVIEGGNLKEYKYLLDRFPKEKRIAHFHGNFIYDKEYDDIYGYYISVSEYIANQFINSGLSQKNRMKVLYNGIEVEKFRRIVSNKEKKELMEKYNIKENDNVIIYCGRIIEKKGVKELLLAFKNSKYLNNSKLLFVGNSVFGNNARTEFDRELEKIAEDIKEKVVFTNFIHNDDLYKIYSIADIAVVPTISEEAFGLVVVEFLASGKPLIVTNSGAFPEIVNSDVAIIINKDEKIKENITNAIDFLIEHPKKREEMQKEAGKVADRFSSEKFYNNFYKIMNDIKKEEIILKQV